MADANNVDDEPDQGLVKFYQLALIAPYFLLDGIALLGRDYFSQPLARFACFIQPYLIASKIFIPTQLIDYANAQCATGMLQEPALSITFFMLKINIAVLMGAIFMVQSNIICVISYIRTGDWLTKNRRKAQEKLKAKYSTSKRLLMAFGLCLFLGLFCTSLYRKYNIPVANFSNSHLKFDENVMAVIVMITSLIYISLFNYIFILPYKFFRWAKSSSNDGNP